MGAIEYIHEKYISLAELCQLFDMEEKGIKDLISLHKKDGKFMRAYKVSAGKYFFDVDDVENYIRKQATSAPDLISET